MKQFGYLGDRALKNSAIFMIFLIVTMPFYIADVFAANGNINSVKVTGKDGYDGYLRTYDNLTVDVNLYYDGQGFTNNYLKYLENNKITKFNYCIVDNTSGSKNISGDPGLNNGGNGSNSSINILNPNREYNCRYYVNNTNLASGAHPYSIWLYDDNSIRINQTNGTYTVDGFSPVITNFTVSGNGDNYSVDFTVSDQPCDNCNNCVGLKDVMVYSSNDEALTDAMVKDIIRVYSSKNATGLYEDRIKKTITASGCLFSNNFITDYKELELTEADSAYICLIARDKFDNYGYKCNDIIVDHEGPIFYDSTFKIVYEGTDLDVEYLSKKEIEAEISIVVTDSSSGVDTSTVYGYFLQLDSSKEQVLGECTTLTAEEFYDLMHPSSNDFDSSSSSTVTTNSDSSSTGSTAGNILEAEDTRSAWDTSSTTGNVVKNVITGKATETKADNVLTTTDDRSAWDDGTGSTGSEVLTSTSTTTESSSTSSSSSTGSSSSSSSSSFDLNSLLMDDNLDIQLCTWHDISIDEVKSAKIAFSASDIAGHETIHSKDVSFKVDVTAPIIMGFDNEFFPGYLNLDNNSMIMDIAEAGSGFHLKQASLDMSAFGVGTKSATNCTSGGSGWVCYLGNIKSGIISTESATVNIKAGSTYDDAGNGYSVEGGTGTKDFYYDGVRPKFINLTMKPYGTDIEDVIINGDVTEITAYITEGESGLDSATVYADYSDLDSSSGLTPATACEPAATENVYKCTWEYSGTLTNGKSITLNVVAFDKAGNKKDSADDGKYAKAKVVGKKDGVGNFFPDEIEIDSGKINPNFLWMSGKGTIQRMTGTLQGSAYVHSMSITGCSADLLDSSSKSVTSNSNSSSVTTNSNSSQTADNVLTTNDTRSANSGTSNVIRVDNLITGKAVANNTLESEDTRSAWSDASSSSTSSSSSSSSSFGGTTETAKALPGSSASILGQNYLDDSRYSKDVIVNIPNFAKKYVNASVNASGKLVVYCNAEVTAGSSKYSSVYNPEPVQFKFMFKYTKGIFNDPGLSAIDKIKEKEDLYDNLEDIIDFLEKITDFLGPICKIFKTIESIINTLCSVITFVTSIGTGGQGGKTCFLESEWLTKIWYGYSLKDAGGKASLAEGTLGSTKNWASLGYVCDLVLCSECSAMWNDILSGGYSIDGTTQLKEHTDRIGWADKTITDVYGKNLNEPDRSFSKVNPYFDPHESLVIAIFCSPPCLSGVVSRLKVYKEIIKTYNTCLNVALIKGEDASECEAYYSGEMCMQILKEFWYIIDTIFKALIHALIGGLEDMLIAKMMETCRSATVSGGSNTAGVGACTAFKALATLGEVMQIIEAVKLMEEKFKILTDGDKKEDDSFKDISDKLDALGGIFNAGKTVTNQGKSLTGGHNTDLNGKGSSEEKKK